MEDSLYVKLYNALEEQMMRAETVMETWISTLDETELEDELSMIACASAIKNSNAERKKYMELMAELNKCFEDKKTEASV